MSDGGRVGPWVAIVVAVIGVAGSVGAAWVTTQTKFDRELDVKAGDIERMKRDLDESERRIREQQAALDRKVAEIEDRQKKLDQKIDLAEKAAAKVFRAGTGLFAGGDK